MARAISYLMLGSCLVVGCLLTIPAEAQTRSSVRVQRPSGSTWTLDFDHQVEVDGHRHRSDVDVHVHAGANTTVEVTSELEVTTYHADGRVTRSSAGSRVDIDGSGGTTRTRSRTSSSTTDRRGTTRTGGSDEDVIVYVPVGSWYDTGTELIYIGDW